MHTFLKKKKTIVKTIIPQNIRITMKIEITIETMEEMKMIIMETTMEITVETMKEMKVIMTAIKETREIITQKTQNRSIK